MKKVLLIGFILAICILAMPQGVFAAVSPVSQSVPISASYPNTLAFTATLHSPSGGWNWVLSQTTNPNTVHPAIDFSVTTLSDWTVMGDDQAAAGATHGHMIGSAHPLGTPFAMTNKGGTFLSFEAHSQTIATGVSSTAAQTWSSDIQQQIQASDYASSSGYSITMKFDCSTPF